MPAWMFFFIHNLSSICGPAYVWGSEGLPSCAQFLRQWVTCNVLAAPSSSVTSEDGEFNLPILTVHQGNQSDD